MPLGSNFGFGFAGLVTEGGVFAALPALSRDAALLALARSAAALTGAPMLAINERLRLREAQGSTGFGNGAAIPHARLPGLLGTAVLLARLPVAVDWQSIDGEPVDVVVLLLSPISTMANGDDLHLKALARISRTLRDPATLPAIRSASSAAAMLDAVATPAALAG